MFRSIRSRLLGLVFATVVPFIALTAVGLWNQWQDDHAAAVQRANSEAQLLAAQVDDHISNLENLMLGLSRAVSTNPADTIPNDALLRKVKAELPPFVSNLLLYSLDGTNIGVSWPEARPRPNGWDRAYFREVLDGRRLAVGEVIRGSGSGQLVITLARPIEDSAGQLRGVLAIGTQLEHFQDALRTNALPSGSIIRIVNERGIVVAQSLDGPNWIGRDLNKAKDGARHREAKEASDAVIWSDNVDRITGSATANRVPWIVSVGLPTRFVFAAVATRAAWSVLFSVLALGVAFTTAWLLSRRIARPLQHLQKDAAILAAGRFDHRTQVRTNDEVGVVADSFNQMAAALERREVEARAVADEVRQAKDTLAAVIDASPVAIICSDPHRRISLWSRAAARVFGYTAEEAVGLPTKIVPPEGAAKSEALFQSALRGETFHDVQLERMRKDGTLVPVSVSASAMYHLDGSVRGVAWAYEDVTERNKAAEQLHRLAHYDQLTGLPNRLLLQKELGRLLSGPARDRPAAIALFDLDGFKEVNDTLGHAIGDELLIEVAHRLTKIAEDCSDVSRVCRLGGDEFVAILPDNGDPLSIAKTVDTLLKRLAEPFLVNGDVVHLGGSAGIAIAPDHGSQADELIANADLALYQAKTAGGRTYRFYQTTLRSRAQARHNLDLELRRALAENEFEVYFQPQIRIADNAVVGMEALLRWRHPVRGILAPAAFIETLGKSSIARDVSNWVIRAACEQGAAWRALGFPLSRIGVNLFQTQWHDETTLQDIEDILRETGLPPEVLELEITENVALNYEHATMPLLKLCEKGVKLAFDDFGTGYASLSSLTRFPISRIKIDRSFVANVTNGVKDAAIVRSLIAMARNLDLGVIAEGVETSAQAVFLRNEGCAEAQGFFYSKPLPATAFEAYLRNHPGSTISPVSARAG